MRNIFDPKIKELVLKELSVLRVPFQVCIEVTHGGLLIFQKD